MINPSAVLHKRTTVPSRIPSSLSAGEIAMNMADGTVFIPNAGGGVFTFANQSKNSFVLQTSLSGSVPQYGNNTITEVFGNVLGGYNNNITGAGSTTVNGENNDIAGDFSFIATGLNNKINSSGDYSAIIAGQYNLINHQNCFTLGSNLSSHANNFTYVNNISATGLLHGTLLDWMTLVRGYKTTPTLNTTIATGEVWNYVYASSPSDKTYYRFIATDGSEDSFYGTFSSGVLSNLITTKKIIL